MRQTKRKNDSQKPPSKFAFIVLWATSYIPLWMGLWILVEMREYRAYEYRAYGTTKLLILGIALMVAASSYLQSQAVERFLNHPMRGWVIAGCFGAILSVFAFDNTQHALFLSAIALFMPISLVQMGWLWRQVKSVWLWPLTSFVAALFFIFPFNGYNPRQNSGLIPFFVLFLGLIHGALQAVVMRHLWTQPRDAEKRKMDRAAEEKSDLERVQRLQEEVDENRSPDETEHPIVSYETKL